MRVKSHLYKVKRQNFGKGDITLQYSAVKTLLNSFKCRLTFGDFHKDRRLCHLYLCMGQSLNTYQSGRSIETESKTETN